MMKIAHVVCTFPPYKGGIGNSAARIAESLAELGNDITVFTPAYDNTIKKEEFVNGFRLIRLRPFIKYGNAAILPQLFFVLKKFDVIHLHYPFFGTAEIILLRKILSRKKIKLIIHYHMDTMASGIKGMIFRLAKLTTLPLIMRWADAITCTTFDYIKNSDAQKYYLQYRDKFVAETFFGVNYLKFIPAENRSGDKTRLLFVGALDQAHYFKGVDILLKAFSRIKGDNNIELRIVGKGELKEVYMTQAQNLEIDNHVTFISNALDDASLIREYQGADIFILPSINKGEAFGLVLLEAMACGIPVIASDLPGVRSVFKNGEQGFSFATGNVESLMEKLLILIMDKDLRLAMGKAGRKLVEEKYSWLKVAERIIKVYK